MRVQCEVRRKEERPRKKLGDGGRGHMNLEPLMAELIAGPA